MIEKIPLDNGLTLELYDRSRNVAGDRWLVSFEARLEVELLPEYFLGKEIPGFSFTQIKSAVGKKVEYLFEKSRNFIAEREKEAVFDELKKRFLSTSLPYLSRPEFPLRLILSEYFRRTNKKTFWKWH